MGRSKGQVVTQPKPSRPKPLTAEELVVAKALLLERFGK